MFGSTSSEWSNLSIVNATYIGMDVHEESLSIAVLNSVGKINFVA